MQYRDNTFLGRPVSVIGFGGAALSGEGGGYGFGRLDESGAEILLKEAWNRGINLYDTAPIYGFGLSEERLGKYLPKEAIIVTKGGVHWHPTKRVNMTNGPKVIEEMLLQSLKRLRREQIDIYMIHWPDPKIDIRRPLDVLQRYLEKGVLLSIGLCNTNSDDLKKAEEVTKITSLQCELNLFNTQGLEQFGPQKNNYFSMGWGTYDKGILSGRVTHDRTFEAEDCRSWAPWWNKKLVASKVDKVKVLEDLLNERSLSLTQFSLQYSINYYGVDSALVGSKTLDDLGQVTKELRPSISREVFEEVLKQWREGP